MRRLLLLAALGTASLAAQAQTAGQQNDPALASTAAQFGSDLDVLARLATAAALIRERTGAYPATAFDLLGSDEAGLTGARALPLSALDVTTEDDAVVLRYVPLPVDPYVRENLVVTATVGHDADMNGQVVHEMRRYAAPADGGRMLLYDRAGAYRVERGYGVLTIDVAAARRAAAAGTFAPRSVYTTSLGDLTVRVHPPGEAEPVYFEGDRAVTDATLPVAVVGAGLAGLACARTLAQAGRSAVVFEASDAVGGRVRTDLVEGFRIDRGFQVLLTAYPEASAVLDYAALDLKPFDAGALVRLGTRWEHIGDPTRDLSALLPTLLARVGSLSDKVRVLGLRAAVTRGTPESLWQRSETTTEDALKTRYGFSDTMIDRFFRPFLGGVLLDRRLGASSRAFEYYFRMFSEGAAAVPARGMQAIPEQMAERLPTGSVRLNTPVAAVAPDGRGVTLASGETLPVAAVVVATDAAQVPGLVPGTPVPDWKGTVQIAWAAEAPPTDKPILMLDGQGRGPVNNAQVMSNVAPGYAPAGQALVTASVLGTPTLDDDALDAEARAQLRGWFGPPVDAWRRLAVHRIPHALPSLPSLDPPERPLHVRDALFMTGDWLRNGSIDGALVAGRHAAEAALEAAR